MSHFSITGGLPIPVRWQALRAGDTDFRFCPWVLPDEDELVNVENIEVRRRDNNPVSSYDLSATEPMQWNIESDVVTIWLRSDPELLSRGVIDYQVSVTMSTGLGRILVRDFYIAVVATLGPSTALRSIAASRPRVPLLTYQGVPTMQTVRTLTAVTTPGAPATRQFTPLRISE